MTDWKTGIVGGQNSARFADIIEREGEFSPAPGCRMSIEINAERAIRSWKTLPRLDRASALARVADWAAKALMVAVVFCVAGVAGLALYASSHAGRVYEGVSVGGIGLGGMSPADAEAALAAGFDRY